MPAHSKTVQPGRYGANRLGLDYKDFARGRREFIKYHPDHTTGTGTRCRCPYKSCLERYEKQLREIPDWQNIDQNNLPKEWELIG